MSKLLPHNQLDIDYLHSDRIGGVISQALTVLYETKPSRPIDFLAHWLFQYSRNELKEITFTQQQKNKEQSAMSFMQKSEEQYAQLQHQAMLEEQRRQVDESFHAHIHSHLYHEELLCTEFCDFIAEHRFADVYVCKLDHPVQMVDLDNDDSGKAHLQLQSPKVLHYMAASVKAQYLVGTSISTDKALITHQCLTEEQQIYIPDVIKDTRVYYHRWPQLGAYFVLPLQYSGCLSEGSFDKGLDARMQYLKQRGERNREIEEKKHNQDQSMDKTSLTIEMQAFLESLPEVSEPPFGTERKQYVLCVDTLGQDKGISEDDRLYLSDYCEYFIKCWEESERAQLSESLELHIKYISSLPKPIEDMVDDINQQELEFIQQQIHESREYEHQNSLNQSLHSNSMEQTYEQENMRLEFLRNRLSNKEFVQPLLNLCQRRVIKYEGVIQCAFYLLNRNKNQVNEPGTNVLDWRKVRKLFNDDFIAELMEYTHKGSKEIKPHPWAMVNRVHQQLEAFDQDLIDSYNVPFGRLYKFLLQTCTLRKLDIERRHHKMEQERKIIAHCTSERDRIIQEKEYALQELQDGMSEEERAEFNEEEWNQQYDTDNQIPTIPEEPTEQIDADYEFE